MAKYICMLCYNVFEALRGNAESICHVVVHGLVYY